MKDTSQGLFVESIDFQKKEVFVFDWDGTIFDSMLIKLENFSHTLAQMVLAEMIVDRSTALESSIESKIQAWYRQLSGSPRKEIFKAILAKIWVEYHVNPELISYAEFSSQLSVANKKRLIQASLFPDAEVLLAHLIKQAKKLCISSSTPQAELDFLVNQRLSSFYLSSMSDVLGSSDGFAKGIEHLSFIAKRFGCSSDSILVIGDDLADRDLSSQAKIDCILVDRENRFIHNSDVCRVNSLDVLGELI